MRNLVPFIVMLLTAVAYGQLGRSARIGEKEIFRPDYNNYWYVGWEYDPVATSKELNLNWVGRVGLVYKWLHIGVSHQRFENLRGADYLDYTVHVGKVWYPGYRWQIFTGVKTGLIERENQSKAYYGFEAETSYVFFKRFAVVGRITYDRRTDWTLFGWTPGFRESGYIGIRILLH